VSGSERSDDFPEDHNSHTCLQLSQTHFNICEKKEEVQKIIVKMFPMNPEGSKKYSIFKQNFLMIIQDNRLEF
jgi:hypothetical protein